MSKRNRFHRRPFDHERLRVLTRREGDPVWQRRYELRQTARTLRAVRFVESLGIRVRYTQRRPQVLGFWDPTRRRTIFVHEQKATAYVVFHEAGHALNGMMCCREHCEYAAHGAAVALAKLAGMRLTKKELKMIDCYAGRTARSACPACRRKR